MPANLKNPRQIHHPWVDPFYWRTADGEEITPQDMSTAHMMATVRLIWNAMAPEHLRFEPPKYVFQPPHYTEEYLRTAVAAMMGELDKRPILTAEDGQTINLMRTLYYRWVQVAKLPGETS